MSKHQTKKTPFLARFFFPHFARMSKIVETNLLILNRLPPSLSQSMSLFRSGQSVGRWVEYYTLSLNKLQSISKLMLFQLPKRILVFSCNLLVSKRKSERLFYHLKCIDSAAIPFSSVFVRFLYIVFVFIAWKIVSRRHRCW